MKKVFLFFIPLFLLVLIGCDQHVPEVKKEDIPVKEKEWEMKTYYLVFLKKGPKRDQDSVTTAKLQEQHLAHLKKMYDTGKMDLCGPLMEDSDIRGVCVYNVGTQEEAKNLAEGDPMIQAGRLIAEVHLWYAGKGSILR